MKKSISILSIACILSVFCFAITCFATPIQVRQNSPDSDNNFERIIKLPHGAKTKQLSESPENSETGEIHNVTAGAEIDNNINQFCAAYNHNIKISVPNQGLSFYLIYYHRIKLADGSWGEWVMDLIGATWYFTLEDARNYHLEFYNYLLEEEGTIPPSKGQFMVEMYDLDGNLIDTFVLSRFRYWYPLLESEKYDDEGYLTQTPSPTSTPVPVENQ